MAANRHHPMIAQQAAHSGAEVAKESTSPPRTSARERPAKVLGYLTRSRNSLTVSTATLYEAQARSAVTPGTTTIGPVCAGADQYTKDRTSQRPFPAERPPSGEPKRSGAQPTALATGSRIADCATTAKQNRRWWAQASSAIVVPR